MSSILLRATINLMAKKRGRGRPPKDADKLRNEALLVRLDGGEKEAFREAAALAQAVVFKKSRRAMRPNGVARSNGRGLLALMGIVCHNPPWDARLASELWS